MKKIRVSIFAILLLCCVVIFVGCSNSDYFEDVPGGDTGSIVTNTVNRKFVYFVRISINTASPSEATNTIVENVQSAGGFVQNQEFSGNGSKTDRVYLTVRIPTEKLDSFVASLGGSGKVVSQRKEITDITTQYVDATAQKEGLQNRKQLLEDLLETEGLSASDKISVISEISSVDTQLQSLELQLKSYDSMVDYSTVTINLYGQGSGVAAAIFSVLAFFSFVGLIVAVSILAIKLADAKKKLKQ